MRRILLLVALTSLVLSSTSAIAPPTTDAASARARISIPTRVTRGVLTRVRIDLPAKVAALDGRVMVSAKAAEVIGVAVPRKSISLMPVAIKNGYAFGAYGLTSARGRTIVDVILLPHKSGRINVRVHIDSLADKKGKRIKANSVAGLKSTGTLGVQDASAKAGTRKGSVVFDTKTASTRFSAPAATGRFSSTRAATRLKSLVGTRNFSVRDQDYARAAWTQARAKSRVCDAVSSTDPNGDGCSDIVDLQAIYAAKGTAATTPAPKATPKPTPKPTPKAVKKPSTTTTGTKTDPGEPEPTAKPEKTTKPEKTEAPVEATPEPVEEPADETSPEAAQGGGDGANGGKGARGKGIRVSARSTSSTADAPGKTFVVRSTADTVDANRGDGICADSQGRCTLRAAIGEADWLAGDDRIEFDLPGAAPVTIQLTSRLPYITSRNGTLTIDGYSQPGAQVNTAQYGSNAVPGVEIRGNGNSAREVGLMITSGGNTVRGLVMNNMWRNIFIDGPNATDNRIVGNWLGFTRTGANASGGNFALILNTGAHHNQIGAPGNANRNVIGNYSHAIENYGTGVDGNVIQNNLLCIRPGGGTATCDVAIDHNFGPKASLIGGDDPGERNVTGPTRLQSIEFSHGWDQALPWGTDTKTTYQINDHRLIGNWLGFRMDGTYDAAYRSGLNRSSADNGNGVNVYDGTNRNLVLRNHIASVYDGVQIMAPNAVENEVRGNTIGEAPSGEAAPLTGWGVKIRWGTKRDVISNNTIRNAALGGVGLVQDTVYNIRISRNIVTDTSGPAIYLAPQSGNPTKGANTMLPAPVITAASTAQVRGTGINGATVEVFRASRAAGQSGLPVEYLGDTTVSGGTWTLNVSGIDAGQRVTALQRRPDDNTSALGINVAVTQAPQPPQSGDTVVSDEFGRTVSSGWGTADQGGAWSLTGTAGDFSVDGSAGVISVAAGQSREARIGTSGQADVAVIGNVTLATLPGGGNAWAYVLARANGNNAFRASIRVAPNGQVHAQLKKAISNTESNIGPEVAVPGLVVTAGSGISFRFRVVGSELRLRVWATSASEPDGWTLTDTDSTAALQGAGSAGLRAYVGGGVPNGPLTFRLDDFRVRLP